jgi:hypothetical protein
MTGTASLVGLIAAVMVLVLAVSSFRSHRLSFAKTAQLAGIWALIIVGLVVVLRFLGA